MINMETIEINEDMPIETRIGYSQLAILAGQFVIADATSQQSYFEIQARLANFNALLHNIIILSFSGEKEKFDKVKDTLVGAVGGFVAVHETILMQRINDMKAKCN